MTATTTRQLVLMLIGAAILAYPVVSFFMHHILAVCYVPFEGGFIQTVCDVSK